MPQSAIEVRKLSPELMQDFLQFFDGEAFADNPGWSFCYCQFLYVDHAKVKWPARTKEENRAAACDRIVSRRMEGYIAYRDGKPIGWCNAAPRTMLDALSDEPDPDALRIGQIGCFVVAKAHRRSGVATSLLHAACAGLKAQGFAIVEALPAAEATSDAQNHFGPLKMYLAAGFHVHGTDEDGRIHVRRSLV
jgi:GNAT superfamily N-acetyltransferase